MSTSAMAFLSRVRERVSRFSRPRTAADGGGADAAGGALVEAKAPGPPDPAAPRMNVWPEAWVLDEEGCPCDLHFNRWLEDRGLRDQVIYHFGTGLHHVVGLRQAENGSGNVVFAVTASVAEYESYVRLVSERPGVSRRYLVYFGDIYLVNARLLPELDVVTLFHLCEYGHPNTASPEYGGLTDRGLLDVLTRRTRPGGRILFYTGSIAFAKAAAVIAAWERDTPVVREGEFETLLVYRKLT